MKYIAAKDSARIATSVINIHFLYLLHMSTSTPKAGFATKKAKGRIPVTVPMTTDDIPSSFPYTGS